MAWKRLRRHKNDSGAWTGFIEQGVKIEGHLELAGIFRIDGQVKGTIISEHSLVLGENSKVEAEIQGNHISIYGRFDGIIYAKAQVEIHPHAIVTGEIHTSCLVLEQGGIFDGTCHMLSAAPSARTITIPIRSASHG